MIIKIEETHLSFQRLYLNQFKTVLYAVSALPKRRAVVVFANAMGFLNIKKLILIMINCRILRMLTLQ